MNHLVRFVAIAAVFAAIVVLSCFAYAGDAPIDVDAAVRAAVEAAEVHTIKYQDAGAYIVGLIGAAVGAAVSFVTNFFFGSKGKVPLKSEHKATLDNAIQVGVLKATVKVQELIRKAPDLDVKNTVVADVANFVTANVPTALTALGITQASLDAYIRNKLDNDDELMAVKHA